MRNLIVSILSIFILCSCSLLVDFEPQKTDQERACDDRVDNDQDGETDCADQDCWESPACVANNVNNVVNPEDCLNDEDDDEDGMIDCEDEDCWEHPHCMVQTEICKNGQDDDGDGELDCNDPDCFGREGCNYPDGEIDCGNLADDDSDGFVDCEDEDCAANFLCTEHLQYCGGTHYFEMGGMSWYYFTNLIGEASIASCDLNYFCTIKLEISETPYCYPKPNGAELAQFYQVCGPLISCGAGMICAHSPTLSPLFGNQEVCLPQCAPGWQPACPGTDKRCMFHWHDSWFAPGEVNVEVWLCDEPECDPMNVDASGCALNRACYPDPSLFGPASCHSAGATNVDSVCTEDLNCVPGAICRYSPEEGENLCHALCVDNTMCQVGEVCTKEDPRQHFGFCQ